MAAFDNGAAREIIGEEAGCFATRNDAASLAAALTAALRIDRRSVRTHVERFYAASRMLDAYEALYALTISLAG